MIRFKGIIHPQIKILSLITPPCVVDSKDPNPIKAQKRSKEIFKIVHFTSVVQL